MNSHDDTKELRQIKNADNQKKNDWIKQEERKRMIKDTPDVEIHREERKNNPPTHNNARRQD